MTDISMLEDLKTTITAYNRKLVETELSIKSMEKDIASVWKELTDQNITTMEELDTKIDELTSSINDLKAESEKTITDIKVEIKRLDSV